MPWNWFCSQERSRYAADFEEAVALCEERKVAVQTVKALARGPWAAGSVAHAQHLVPAASRMTRTSPTTVRWLVSQPGDLCQLGR